MTSAEKEIEGEKNIPPKTWTVTRKDSAAISGEKKTLDSPRVSADTLLKRPTPVMTVKRTVLATIQFPVLEERGRRSHRDTHTHSLHNGTERAL